MVKRDHMEKLIKLIKLIKLSPKYLFEICVLFGILLFANRSFLRIIGLDLFVEKYRIYLGVIFLASMVFLIVDISCELLKIVKNKVKSYINKKYNIKYLKNLSEEEKDVLRKYITNHKKSCKLDITNGLLNELEVYQIIYRSSQIGIGMDFSYNIQPWAWEYLNKHKELLNISDVEI